MSYKRRRYKRKGSVNQYEILFLIFVILVVYSQMGSYKGVLNEVLQDFKSPFIVVGAVLLILLYIAFKVVPVYRRRHKYRTARMAEIDRMKGTQFESFLSVYFRDMGYKILPHRGGAGDKGADLLINAPDGRSYVVQAKRYKGKVPFTAIQQVHAARSLYKTDSAIIISNNYFTKQSKETAEKLNIELWDRTKLMENMYRYRKQREDNHV